MWKTHSESGQGYVRTLNILISTESGKAPLYPFPKCEVLDSGSTRDLSQTTQLLAGRAAVSAGLCVITGPTR